MARAVTTSFFRDTSLNFTPTKSASDTKPLTTYRAHLHAFHQSFFLKYISSFLLILFEKSGILRMRALPATYVEGFHNLEAVKKMNYQPLGRTGMDVSKLSFGKVVSESFNQTQKCWDTPTKNRPFSLQIAAIHTSVRNKTPFLPPLHSKQEPINWWTPVQSCSSKFWAWSSVASNLDI